METSLPTLILAHSNDLSTAIIINREIHGETDPLPRVNMKSSPRSGKESGGGAAAAWRGEQSPRAMALGRVPVDSAETPRPWGAARRGAQPRGDEYVDSYASIHIPGEGVQSLGQPKMARVFSYCYYVSIYEYCK